MRRSDTAVRSVQGRWLRFGDHVPGMPQDRAGQFQACLKTALVEPSVQETGIKGVSATCTIYDINLLCLAEKTLASEIGFCTCLTQRGYHSYIVFQRSDPSVRYHTLMLVHFPLGFIHENYVYQFVDRES